MIFVTVGTHEQQFNRLVEFVDRMKENGLISEEVIIQTGYSTYEPKFCRWQKTFPFEEMKRLIQEARIVITHGGPASFILPLQIGKIPIVVPRRKAFNEHVNDHQAEFATAVAERMGTILVVHEIGELKNLILNYDAAVANMNSEIRNNNEKFNEEFEQLVNDLFPKDGE